MVGIDNEDWIPVKGYPAYEVNKYGKIRNRRTKMYKTYYETSDGYLKVTLNAGVHGSNHAKLVHRVVLDSFTKGDHTDLQVNHIDGNKHNNGLDNLEWVTGSQNVLHAYQSGLRKPSGGRGIICPIGVEPPGLIFPNLAEAADYLDGSVSGLIRAIQDDRLYKGKYYCYKLSPYYEMDEADDYGIVHY